MANSRNNRSTLIISLALHILLACVMFNSRNVQTMVPSRSNGIEVSLVTPSELSSTSNKVILEKNVAQDRIQNTSADINLKQTEDIKVQENKLLQPKANPTPAPPIPVPNPKKIKKPQPNKQISDLLSDLTPTENAGNSTGSATGGTNLGTADTDNMLSNYADLVIARVRPYVINPDGLDNSAKAIIEVTLLPNMQVYKVRLVKSSGNSEYDQNVQQAINRAAVFPPLPEGANFADYRKIKLTFRPQ